MNYRNNSIRELLEVTKHLNYSLGELLYASSRIAGVKKMGDLLTVSDEDFYSAINSVVKVEKEELFKDDEDFKKFVEKMYE